jgi:hypothetical protein
MGPAGAVITRRLCAVPLVRRDRRDRAVIADSRGWHCRRLAPSELYYPRYEFIFVHERDTFY